MLHTDGTLLMSSYNIWFNQYGGWHHVYKNKFFNLNFTFFNFGNFQFQIWELLTMTSQTMY